MSRGREAGWRRRRGSRAKCSTRSDALHGLLKTAAGSSWNELAEAR